MNKHFGTKFYGGGGCDNEFLMLILLSSTPPVLLSNHFELSIQEKPLIIKEFND